MDTRFAHRDLRSIGINSCRIHPQDVGAVSDDVAASAQRLGQGSELAARHEQIDATMARKRPW
jgi:hypothetical protein